MDKLGIFHANQPSMCLDQRNKYYLESADKIKKNDFRFFSTFWKIIVNQLIKKIWPNLQQTQLQIPVFFNILT